MKTHRKLILVAAAVLVVGGAGTGVTLAMQDEPRKVVVEQSASVEPQNEPVEAVVEQETATEPVEQEEVPVEPVETLQEEVKRKVEEHAAKYDLDPTMQNLCMDRLISKEAEGGYDNEERVRQILDVRLGERLNEQGGHLVVYFSGGCTHTYTKTVYL